MGLGRSDTVLDLLLCKLGSASGSAPMPRSLEGSEPLSAGKDGSCSPLHPRASLRAIVGAELP